MQHVASHSFSQSQTSIHSTNRFNEPNKTPTTSNHHLLLYPFKSPPHTQMRFLRLNLTRSKAKTFFFSLLISSSILISYTGWSSVVITSLVQVASAFLLVALIVVAARATVVAWITVLVLLAFAGNRRRVLVAQGRKITTEVAMYLVKVVIKERSGVAAVACATVISLMAMRFLRNAWYIGPTVILD